MKVHRTIVCPANIQGDYEVRYTGDNGEEWLHPVVSWVVVDVFLDDEFAYQEVEPMTFSCDEAQGGWGEVYMACQSSN